ncbi:Alpha-1,3-mannosyltransferase [Thalictrum thalictroides]|uniref:Alpha-1,3-mannosyltransferase n=1 Tax=Thalictrum thalictroides TaxID=46969 RepID=A0A7J6WLY7_THATH|nr:Alpha-1,3-mannosyltransferase [Thalictrum thalictroides]
MNSISMTKASSSFHLTFSTTSSSSSSSSSPSSIFSKSQIYPSSSSSRFACRSQLNSREDLPFILHDTLQTSGIDITHAKEAREGFVSQIKRLSKIERQISIAINASADLAKTALLIAAEDDALVSHSSVPLPVKSFIERLDALSMGFVSYYSLNLRSASPEVFFDGLEKYLYGYKVKLYASSSSS